MHLLCNKTPDIGPTCLILHLKMKEYVAIILILSMSLILQFVMCQDEQEYVAYAPEHEHDSKFIIFFNYLFAIFEIKLNQLCLFKQTAREGENI